MNYKKEGIVTALFTIIFGIALLIVVILGSKIKETMGIRFLDLIEGSLVCCFIGSLVLFVVIVIVNVHAILEEKERKERK